jgi:hypothetical protein
LTASASCFSQPVDFRGVQSQIDIRDPRACRRKSCADAIVIEDAVRAVGVEAVTR